MNLQKIYFLIFSLLISVIVIGQDLNQTNFRYAPLYLNPANTGFFNGNIRLSGTYRSQFNSFIVNGYQTQQVAADAALGYGFRKYDWVGVGVHLFSDKAGDLSLSNSGALLGVSYNFAFDKKYNKILTVGVQYGLSQRKLDASLISVESDFRPLPNGNPMDKIMLQNFEGNTRDVNAGVRIFSRINKTSSLGFGVSMYHILRPSYEGLRLNYMDQRLTSHLNYKTSIGKRTDLNSEIIVSLSGKATNVMPQFTTSYKLKKDKANTDEIYFGLGYRVNDALQAMVGMNYKKWDFGLSYDFTISSASVYNNHNGAIEFGVFRILDIPRTPKVIPMILCPRL